jgi:hypothetical protein
VISGVEKVKINTKVAKIKAKKAREVWIPAYSEDRGRWGDYYNRPINIDPCWEVTFLQISWSRPWPFTSCNSLNMWQISACIVDLERSWSDPDQRCLQKLREYSTDKLKIQLVLSGKLYLYLNYFKNMLKHLGPTVSWNFWEPIRKKYCRRGKLLFWTSAEYCSLRSQVFLKMVFEFKYI